MSNRTPYEPSEGMLEAAKRLQEHLNKPLYERLGYASTMDMEYADKMKSASEYEKQWALTEVEALKNIAKEIKDSVLKDMEEKELHPKCTGVKCENYAAFNIDNKLLCHSCAKNHKQSNHSLVPGYYGGGKVIDPYKYCTIHSLRPAVAHAIKYATRAGKKDGETYEKGIQNAIDALKRDLEIYKEEISNT